MRHFISKWMRQKIGRLRWRAYHNVEGAVYSIELVFGLPILWMLFAATIEYTEYLKFKNAVSDSITAMNSIIGGLPSTITDANLTEANNAVQFIMGRFAGSLKNVDFLLMHRDDRLCWNYWAKTDTDADAIKNNLLIANYPNLSNDNDKYKSIYPALISKPCVAFLFDGVASLKQPTNKGNGVLDFYGQKFSNNINGSNPYVARNIISNQSARTFYEAADAYAFTQAVNALAITGQPLVAATSSAVNKVSGWAATGTGSGATSNRGTKSAPATSSHPLSILNPSPDTLTRGTNAYNDAWWYFTNENPTGGNKSVPSVLTDYRPVVPDGQSYIIAKITAKYPSLFGRVFGMAGIGDLTMVQGIRPTWVNVTSTATTPARKYLLWCAGSVKSLGC